MTVQPNTSSVNPPGTSIASPPPQIVERRADLAVLVRAAHAQGKQVGVVPTMGALHAGHLSLVEAACRQCGFVIVTIFVNPTQFGPQEDFRSYPRTLDADLRLLAALPVDVVYAPRDEEIYPPGFATYVEVGGVAKPLEGARRPGHFRGVATVVLKLFEQTSADVAYFGQKDFQQTRVIHQMVRDFDLPVRVEVCPTIREPDGLAMSSRNAYLSLSERERALVLSQSLRLAQQFIESGGRSAATILSQLRPLYAGQPGIELEYLVIANPETLEEVEVIRLPVVIAVAARVGRARLIDNVIVTSGAAPSDQEDLPG